MTTRVLTYPDQRMMPQMLTCTAHPCIPPIAEKETTVFQVQMLVQALEDSQVIKEAKKSRNTGRRRDLEGLNLRM